MPVADAADAKADASCAAVSRTCDVDAALRANAAARASARCVGRLVSAPRAARVRPAATRPERPSLRIHMPTSAGAAAAAAAPARRRPVVDVFQPPLSAVPNATGWKRLPDVGAAGLSRK